MKHENGQGVALVVGAGDGTGAAVARRFARAGYLACVTRRRGELLQPLVDEITAAGGRARSFSSDARDEEAVVGLVEQIEQQCGSIEVAVFNVGANIRFDIVDYETRKFRKIWEMGCLSGFLVGREVARRMVPRQRGTILFTGATASIRGGRGFAGFAAAKFGLRALAQSMARELGPQGIHVAHVIIDGVIDTQATRDFIPEAFENRGKEGLLQPAHIAEQYWALHVQPRSAWTLGDGFASVCRALLRRGVRWSTGGWQRGCDSRDDALRAVALKVVTEHNTGGADGASERFSLIHFQGGLLNFGTFPFCLDPVCFSVPPPGVRVR